MKLFELFLLLEYSRAKTIDNYGEKIIKAFSADTLQDYYDRDLRRYKVWIHTFRKYIDRDDLDLDLRNIYDDIKPKIINGILAGLEAADPSTNKEYVQWLTKMYCNGTLYLEDANRVNLLGLYDIGKKHGLLPPQYRDINKFKAYGDFEDFVESISNDILRKISIKKKELPKGNAETVYEDGDVRIVVPHDEAAACYYGQGTRWCTASTEGDNYFEQYDQRGPLFILIPKKQKYDREKYQLHFNSNSFMNELDSGVSIEYIFERFPGTQEYFMKHVPAIKSLIKYVTFDELLEISDKIKEVLLKQWKNIRDSNISWYKNNISEPFELKEMEDVCKRFDSIFHKLLESITPGYIKVSSVKTHNMHTQTAIHEAVLSFLYERADDKALDADSRTFIYNLGRFFQSNYKISLNNGKLELTKNKEINV